MWVYSEFREFLTRRRCIVISRLISEKVSGKVNHKKRTGRISIGVRGHDDLDFTRVLPTGVEVSSHVCHEAVVIPDGVTIFYPSLFLPSSVPQIRRLN